MAFWRSLRINVIELPSNQAATIEPVVSWSNRTQLVSLFPGIDFSKGTLQKMDEFRRPKSTTLLEPGQPWSYVFFQSGWGFPWVQVTFIWPSAFPWPTRGVLKDNFDTPPQIHQQRWETILGSAPQKSRRMSGAKHGKTLGFLAIFFWAIGCHPICERVLLIVWVCFQLV